MLALGAQAAWLGTRFLLAEEMPIHRALRNSTADAWQAAGRPRSPSGPERVR